MWDFDRTPKWDDGMILKNNLWFMGNITNIVNVWVDIYIYMYIYTIYRYILVDMIEYVN